VRASSETARRVPVGDGGFALAALLVVIAVMSVVMMVALPTWRHQVQREKEAELIFRGEQYARAIGLYQRKHPGAFPASLDVLVEQKYLRKKYKDPITGEDFVPVYANAEVRASTAEQRMQVHQQVIAGSIKIERSGPDEQGRMRFNVARTAGLAGGIVGVASKSTAQSIRLYNGRDRYDQWVFTYTAASPQAGVGNAPAVPRPDGAQPDPSTRPGLPQRSPLSGRGRGGQ
jgi:type II secretory pathway pseudopilin PulG